MFKPQVISPRPILKRIIYYSLRSGNYGNNGTYSTDILHDETASSKLKSFIREAVDRKEIPGNIELRIVKSEIVFA